MLKHKRSATTSRRSLLVWALVWPIYFNLGTTSTNVPALLGIGQYTHIRSVHCLFSLYPSRSASPSSGVGLCLVDTSALRSPMEVGLPLSASFGYFGSRDVQPEFIYQTILPLLAFFLGATIEIDRGRDTASRASSSGLQSPLSFSRPLILRDIQLLSSNDVDSVIPQFKIYFPIVGVIGTCAAVVLYRSHRLLAAVFVVAELFMLRYSWSRTGFVMVCAAGAATYLVSRRDDSGAPQTVSLRRLVTLVLLLPFIFFVVAAILDGTLLVQRFESGLEFGLSTNRSKLLVDGIARVFASPVFGDMFVAVDPSFLSQATSQVRLYPSHNQYLEFALRGGLPAFGLISVFYFRIATDIRLVLRTRGPYRGVVAAAAGIFCRSAHRQWLQFVSDPAICSMHTAVPVRRRGSDCPRASRGPATSDPSRQRRYQQSPLSEACPPVTHQAGELGLEAAVRLTTSLA